MTVAVHQANRVRCRLIEENDLDGLADLLTRGFPQTRRDYWTKGFARWKRLAAVPEMPRFGYLLDSGFGPVGAILMISSRRGGQVITHLCGWHVDPQWGSQAVQLISQATRLRQVTYVSATPAPQTWRLLQMQGFSPYNFGRTLVFAPPGRGRVSEQSCKELPEAQIMRDHRAMGWICLTVERDGIVSPFVFRPQRVGTLPVMEVLFCRGAEDLKRCAPALARYFLPRGSLGFLIDGDMACLLSHYAEGSEPRYFKGPTRPLLGDLAYTEKAVFG